MKRLYLLCALSCLCYIAALADEDCDQAVYEAKIAYNAGNYAKAKSLFDYVVSECGANYGNAASWVQKCKDELTPKLTASRTYISVGATSGMTSINVTSNREWKLQNTTSDMFSVSKNGGSVTINYYTNSKSSSRSDYFDIVTLDGSKSVRITIAQSAAAVTLTVSKTAVSCSASGTTEYLTVSCNKPWEIQYTSGCMYSATRNGNTVIVKINANTSTSSRTSFFNIRTTDGSKVQKISLSQTGRSSGSSKSSSSTNSSGNTTTNTTTLSVSKTSISASSYGTTEYITVTSNKPWEVQYPSGPIYSVTRSGNTLTVKIKENISEESHVDFFYVKTTDGSKVQKISLSQTGSTSSSSSSSNKNRSYRHSSYSKPLSKFNSSNGDFEMFWWGISTGLGTAYSFESSAFAMRWSWFGFDPIIGGVKYSFLSDDFVGYYQPDFKFYIPWNSECAVTLAVGPSIEFGGYYGVDFWFKTELGIHWHYGYATSSNFFLRYDGDFTAGVSIQFSSGW